MDVLAFLAGIVAGLITAAVLVCGIFYAFQGNRGTGKQGETAVALSSSIASVVEEATPTVVIDDETGKSFSYVRSRASRLGLGRYGVVFKGACLQSESEVAIKLVSRRQYGDEQRPHKYFEREVATLKIGSMVSKNVVEFLGSAMDHVSLMVVTEYCEKGDMSRWMDGELSKDLDDGVHLATVLEAYVQLARFVRGSLQWTYPNDPGDSPMATNYSIAEPAAPFTVKIGDFGLARFLDDPDDLSVGVGTEGYMAPEVRIGAAYATNCDLYSVGVMLKRDLERSLGPDIRYLDDMSSRKVDFRHVVLNLTSADPRERPSLESLITNMMNVCITADA